MAYPMFVQSGMTTFVFPRGPSGDEDTPVAVPQPRQLLTYGEAGHVRVVSVGPADALDALVFLLPLTVALALAAWLNDPLVFWAAHPFTYTDVDGASWTVRCIANNFTRKGGAPLITVRLTLRREVV